MNAFPARRRALRALAGLAATALAHGARADDAAIAGGGSNGAGSATVRDGATRGPSASADALPPRRPLRATERRPLLRPPLLRPKAVVGLIAPGGVLDDKIIETCVRNLESQGFTVKPGANLRASHGGYAGTIRQRVDDLHAMFGDREVQAIWTARGGSGCTGLLPHLRYDFIRRHAKILIGYSDITALHLALLRQAGLVSFHGPVAWSTFSSYSVEHMLAVLMEPRRQYAIAMAEENAQKAATQPQFAAQTLHPGVAEGRLIGGNLSLVAALAGTPFAADFRGRLLFLEEVGEAPYRVDRMLTQLDQAIGLQRAAGALLGVFQKSGTDKDPSLSLNDVLAAHFADGPKPAVYGWSFGHIPQQFTLPVGVRARMDTEARTLTLLEPAVRAPDRRG